MYAGILLHVFHSLTYSLTLDYLIFVQKDFVIQWNLVSSPPSVQGQIVARGEVAS